MMNDLGYVRQIGEYGSPKIRAYAVVCVLVQRDSPRWADDLSHKLQTDTGVVSSVRRTVNDVKNKDGCVEIAMFAKNEDEESLISEWMRKEFGSATSLIQSAPNQHLCDVWRH